MAAPQPRTFYVITVRGDVGPLDRSELRAQTNAGVLHKDDRVRNAFGRPLGTVASVLSDPSAGRTTTHGLTPVEPPRARRPPARRPIAPVIIGVTIALLCLGLLIVYLGIGRKTAPAVTPAPVATPAPQPVTKPVTKPAEVVPAATAGGLPPGWAKLDLGNARPPGSASHAGGVWTLEGGGQDIRESKDECLWVHRVVNGDFDASVRVVSRNGTHEWDKAGLMVRPNLEPSQATVAASITHRGVLEFLRRGQAGNGLAATIAPTIRLPAWLRLSRRGGMLHVSYSQDGLAWTGFGEMAVDSLAGGGVRLGLFVCSHDSNTLNRTVFDNLTVVSPP